MCALYFSVLLLYHSLKQKAIPRHSFLAGINTYAKHVCWRRRDGGINTYAKHVCWRRRDGGINTYVKHCLIPRRPAMIHKVTFLLLVLLYDQKYQKSHKVVPALCILPASSRFALCKQPSPSGANIASEPSRYSLATATGSKRSSADSDSLLCHVRLWRTSRFKFGCVSWCEHSEIGFILIVPSAHSPYPRPPCTFSGRADNACTNLLGSLVRYVRTRGIAKIVGSVKLTTCTINPCRTHLPRTTSCD